MHRHRSEEAPDGVGAAGDRGAGGDGQKAESELAQQRQAPPVVCETGTRLALGEVRGGGCEPPVVSPEAVPGVGDRLVQAFAGREPVVLGPGAGKRRTRAENALQEVRRQQPALGADGLELRKWRLSPTFDALTRCRWMALLAGGSVDGGSWARGEC